ncbi:hypothetical protein RUND412_001155 [Rhizina undulata]
MEFIARDLSLFDYSFGNFSVVSLKLLKDLQDGDLGEKQFSGVEDRPYGDKILQLSPSLLHDAIESAENNGRAREIGNLSVADKEGLRGIISVDFQRLYYE